MSSAATLLGHVIGGYQLKQVLGRGATSAVFLGESITSPQELVAVKVLLPPPYFSELALMRCRKRFVREILTLRERLHHPSILPILASGEDPSTQCAYQVMPYISGGSLADRLTGSGDLPLNKISHHVTQIAEALDYAHSQQVIHRDLKPANILIDEEDHIYLADFGIAKLFDSTLTRISEPGQAIGTPGYMAPEQVWGTQMNSATDIYGLAALTYTLLTKRLPFPSTSTAQMLIQVIMTPPTPPRTFRLDLPEPAEAVILRALNKDPQDRFATAHEFAQALAQGLEGIWPQDLKTAIRREGTAAPPPQMNLPLHAESGADPHSQIMPVPVAFLPESVATLDEHNTPNNHINPLEAGKKHRSRSVLVSRRAAFTGLTGLFVVAASILWCLLNTPSFSPVSPPIKSKNTSLHSNTRVQQHPSTSPTPNKGNIVIGNGNHTSTGGQGNNNGCSINVSGISCNRCSINVSGISCIGGIGGIGGGGGIWGTGAPGSTRGTNQGKFK